MRLQRLSSLILAIAVAGSLSASAWAADGQIDILPDGVNTLTILDPGSYVLVDNVTMTQAVDCIQIAADNVTLDLNGHTIDGAAVGLNGIIQPPGTVGVVIFNGAVTSFTQRGLDLQTLARVRDLTVRSNGDDGLLVGSGSVIQRVVAQGNAGSAGIKAGDGSSISHCTAMGQTSGADGIVLGLAGTVLNSSAFGNDGDGFNIFGGAVAKTCTSRGNQGNGFVLIAGQLVDCMAGSNMSDGINSTGFSIIDRCQSVGNTGDGIEVANNSIIIGNRCSGNGSAAIRVTGGSNRIDSNHAAFNTGEGFAITGTVNIIVRNTAKGNSPDYSVVPGNMNAQVIIIPGAAFVSTDPWANFSF